jgi:hypothetical protein
MLWPLTHFHSRHRLLGARAGSSSLAGVFASGTPASSRPSAEPTVLAGNDGLPTSRTIQEAAVTAMESITIEGSSIAPAWRSSRVNASLTREEIDVDGPRRP